MSGTSAGLPLFSYPAAEVPFHIAHKKAPVLVTEDGRFFIMASYFQFFQPLFYGLAPFQQGELFFLHLRQAGYLGVEGFRVAGEEVRIGDGGFEFGLFLFQGFEAGGQFFLFLEQGFLLFLFASAAGFFSSVGWRWRSQSV